MPRRENPITINGAVKAEATGTFAERAIVIAASDSKITAPLIHTCTITILLIPRYRSPSVFSSHQIQSVLESGDHFPFEAAVKAPSMVPFAVSGSVA